MSFTQWLIDNDAIAAAEEESVLSDKVKVKLKAQYDLETKPPETSAHGKSFLDTLDAEKKEKARIDAIDEIGAAAIKTYPTQIEAIETVVRAAHADKTVDVKDFELQLLRATRPIGPSNVARRDKDIGSKVIEAAVCQTIGLRNIEKHYKEPELEAAHKHFPHGIGLQQLLFKAAAANGQHFDSAANLAGLLRAAFGSQQIQASGFSTISLPGILANVFNKQLHDFFMSVDQTWRQIAQVSSVRDFKAISGYSLSGDLQYEELGAAGEIKHGTLGEQTYANQAKTYAKMLAITRQDLINDDLGAFQRIPQRLGRGGALAVNHRFWTVFLDNSAHFAAGNNNVSTGAGSALATADAAAIGAAELKFRNQTDPDGKPLAISPRIMLVPPTLANVAARWMGGQTITGLTALPELNVYAGRYRVLSSPYMENSSYTGYSAAAWYLLADPADLPTIQVVFLNGRDTPIVESAEADFDTLGIQFRGYHDFGVAFVEPRAGVRSAGS
jgi:phage major head subunit gpT-like protein